MHDKYPHPSWDAGKSTHSASAVLLSAAPPKGTENDSEEDPPEVAQKNTNKKGKGKKSKKVSSWECSEGSEEFQRPFELWWHVKAGRIKTSAFSKPAPEPSNYKSFRRQERLLADRSVLMVPATSVHH